MGVPPKPPSSLRSNSGSTAYTRAKRARGFGGNPHEQNATIRSSSVVYLTLIVGVCRHARDQRSRKSAMLGFCNLCHGVCEYWLYTWQSGCKDSVWWGDGAIAVCNV